MRHLCFVLLLLGCRDSAYNAASKADTLDGWRKFVAENPNDGDIETAKDRLNELELKEAEAAHTVVAYKRFLERTPEGERARRARALLEGLRFNAAKETGTALAFRQFLREHDEGAHHEEAEQLLKELERKEVLASDDPAQLAKVAATHAGSPDGEAASARLDEKAFAAAKTPAALFAYLRDYPAGAHRDEVRAALLSLQLEGLLLSNQLEEAAALAKRAPLIGQVPDWSKRLAHAEALRGVLVSKDARVRTVVGADQPTVEATLERLQASDPLERWQAAQTLGEYVSIKPIDPLLNAIRTSRVTLVRDRAFAALGRLLKALPREVAEYEVAARIDALSTQASDAQLYLTMAVLLDLTGQLEKAAAEYQRAWDAAYPDPLILRRWTDIRRERGQKFSMAVAARQLGVWAKAQADDAGPFNATNALWASRELCAAAEYSRLALAAIELAKGATEFPEDIATFAVGAQASMKLSEARLRDAELVLLETDATAKTCTDDSATRRSNASVTERLKALTELKAKPVKEQALVLEFVSTRASAEQLRAAARAP